MAMVREGTSSWPWLERVQYHGHGQRRCLIMAMVREDALSWPWLEKVHHAQSIEGTACSKYACAATVVATSPSYGNNPNPNPNPNHRGSYITKLWRPMPEVSLALRQSNSSCKCILILLADPKH